MKYPHVLLSALCTLLPAALSTAAISTSFVQGANLSKTTDSSTVSLSVSPGDMVVYTLTPNKKLTAGTYTFSEVSADGATIGDRTDINSTEDFGTTGENLDPTLWLSYATVTTGGTLEVTVTDDLYFGDTSLGTTANWGAYVISGDNLQVVVTAANAFAYTEVDFGVTPTIAFANSYALGGNFTDVLVVEILGGTRCDVNPASDNLIGTDGELPADPAVIGWDIVTDRRLIGDGMATGEVSSITTTYDVTLQSGKTGNITGTALGIAIAGDSGSGGPTWYGYDVDPDGWADTGAWMGWVYAGTDPWIYNQKIGTWMYAPSEQSSLEGAWFYLVQ